MYTSMTAVAAFLFSSADDLNFEILLHRLFKELELEPDEAPLPWGTIKVMLDLFCKGTLQNQVHITLNHLATYFARIIMIPSPCQ
ncbi:hypothetical protein BRADI_1g46216v3 [Brachypodium distachyon]|uniref:Uncharacterized protein n=1 Tax=Brachypodium distachyon TaxID=15368 RepID=A0A2K2DPP4_BRADI|nr:hypothetical protein BRADI_1g46216v3 [Brachypodium distachyon]